MQRWFESRLDPFPDAPPAQPPATLYAFCRHYTRGAERWLLLLTISTGLIALAEVALYAYVGALVDRMNAVGPGAFMAQEGPRLAWMAALVLVVLPSLVLLNSLVQHQTLLGNFPMRIRWNVHRYLLRQSMGYFQDEFAGRIATKLMQTSLAVRETVVKLLDIGNYVLVYFGGTLIVAASADWRLMLPFVGWLVCYALLMRWFVPRMGKVSQQQADARSLMTGRIVDSYTNIATVKLFSHSQREQAYAREAMDGFPADGEPADAAGDHRAAGVLYTLNMALLLARWARSASGCGCTGTTAWARSRSPRRWRCACSACRTGSCGNCPALFENIGTVHDGISSISLPPRSTMTPGAPALPSGQGRRPLRRRGLPLRQGQRA
jgi:ATP-binding cassette subfamily B multidrug efflux pump